MQRLRPAALVVAAGALVGIVVGGIGGRLAMGLLAALNPAVRGVESDDGFVMGQFGVGDTINLLAVCAVLGAIGGLVYLAVRRLLIGPRWFRLATLAVGAGVVVGAALVHTDGVDFTMLEPLALTLGLFVLIPALYALTIDLIADRAIGPPPPAGAAAAWLGRAGLVAVFAFGAVDLAADVSALNDR